jgi:hypothetical protein
MKLTIQLLLVPRSRAIIPLIPRGTENKNLHLYRGVPTKFTHILMEVTSKKNTTKLNRNVM